MSKKQKNTQDSPLKTFLSGSWNNTSVRALSRIVMLILGIIMIILALLSCSFTYKFDGGSINYELTKNIRIEEFPNRSPLVNPFLAQIFDQKLRTRFIEQTRLKPVDGNADIEISGEITRYDIQGLAVKEDAYSSQTRLTIAVRVQYINNKELDKDVDQTFTANREFSSERSLDDVQDDLCRQICDDLIDQIYNATVANW
jgi:hypothetical protein